MTSVVLPAPAAASAARMQGLAAILFRGRANTALSLVMLAGAAWILLGLYGWAWRDAVFAGDAARCRAAGGACWAFVIDKLAFSIHGLYPPAEQWRPAIVLAALACTIAASLVRIEAYVFAALVYFVVCYGMSLYSRRLERDLNPERRPPR